MTEATAQVPGRRRGWRSLARGAAVAVVLIFVVTLLVTNWDGVRAAFVRLTVGDAVVSLATAGAGILASMLSWRAVVEGAGSSIGLRAASRVFFLAQLGKYVPGSVWPIVAQMELSQRYAVPRARAAFAALTQMLVGVASGIVVAAAALVLSPSSALDRYWWVSLVGGGALVCLAPPVLNFGVRVAGRLTAGRLELAEPLPWSAIGRATVWAVVMWLAFGLHVWVLAARMSPHAQGLWLLSTGGYALASVVGILIVVLPAGAGAREAVLVLAFAGAMGRDDALVVALVSRFVMLAADLLGALVAVVLAKGSGPVRTQGPTA
ncbi:MAG: lysylphosphatidylglycerol synthase domain-containing protein [Cellulomonadaceae bacterium]